MHQRRPPESPTERPTASAADSAAAERPAAAGGLTPGGTATGSLSRRLSVAIALVLAAGGLMVTLAALAFGRQAADDAYDRLLVGAASQIANTVTIQAGRIQVDLPVSAFDLLALAENDRVFYRVVDSDGQTLTGYDDLALPAQTDTAQRQFYVTRYRGEPVRVVAQTRRFAERAFSGSVIILVGHTRLARQTLAAEILTNTLLVVIAAGLAMIGLAVFAVRSALQPLQRIGHELRARDPQDLTALDVRVPRELQPVVTVINRFMSRLDQQMSVMRHLIADSAHQLRTPIATIRAQAQMAADEHDAERQRAIVARIHERSIGLSRLTDQLLNHAMVIHRVDSVPRVALDLREVAISSASEFDQNVTDAGIRLDLDLPELAVMISGDALSLTEACKNLVNNACRHGASPITLGVCHRDGAARLSVRDLGPGIAPDRLQSMTDRFHQSGSIRDGSSGLGLSIVHEVVRAHNGRLEFGSAAQSAFEVAMVFPDAPQTQR